MDYKIKVPNKKEEKQIDDGLMAYNLQQVPATQEVPFFKICRCAVDEKGKLIGGVLACSVLWNVLYVETVWVSDRFRGQRIASGLLKEVEKEAREKGCYIAQLDTFDFQARGFYERQGYQVFGTLKDTPKGHERYYLSKVL